MLNIILSARVCEGLTEEKIRAAGVYKMSITNMSYDKPKVWIQVGAKLFGAGFYEIAYEGPVWPIVKDVAEEMLEEAVNAIKVSGETQADRVNRVLHLRYARRAYDTRSDPCSILQLHLVSTDGFTPTQDEPNRHAYGGLTGMDKEDLIRIIKLSA